MPGEIEVQNVNAGKTGIDLEIGRLRLVVDRGCEEPPLHPLCSTELVVQRDDLIRAKRYPFPCGWGWGYQ